MSHEIRTPLNGVIGMSSMLSATRLSDEQVEFVSTIQTSAQALLALINDILDISKIEAGKVEVDNVPFDLHALLNTIIRMFSPQASARGLSCKLHISADTPYGLVGNALHLRQVLINLVSNALKFTERGGIEINVSTVDNSGSEARLRFEIIDSGIGIAKEAQQSIFASFQQADQSITRKYGGSGLGTSISRHLVTLMGGEIGLVSQLDEGTKFWFELPFVLDEQSREPDISTDIIHDSRVLLVATAGKRHDVLTEHLATWQFDWSHAGSADRARNLLTEKNRYDVALIDEEGLDMAADEFADKVLGDNKAEKCHLILMSGNPQQNEQQLLSAGYFCVLKTPIEKSLLYNTLHATSKDLDTDNSITRLSDYRTENSSSRSLRILVGEDNLTNQKVIAKILEFAGHTVNIVGDGEAVLDALDVNDYDLIIMDLHMPVMGGIEAAKLYSFSRPADERVPVIILTADATVEAEQSAREAGVAAYLTKPIETKKLLNVILEHTRTSTKETGSSRPVTPVRHAVVEGLHTDLLDIGILKDLAALSRDIDFMHELVHGFLDDTKKLIDRLHANPGKHAIQEMQDILHALKGSSRSIGATALASQAAIMHHDMKLYNRNRLTDDLAILHRRYDDTRAALLDHMDKLESAAL